MSPESTRRREIDAAPTTLGDGRRWGLARPATRFRPAIARGLDALGRPTETVHLAVEYGYPAGIHRAIDRLRSECQGGDARGQHVALAALGVALLVRAHDVPDSFAAGLFEADPTSFARIAEAILDVVTTENHPDSRTRKHDDERPI